MIEALQQHYQLRHAQQSCPERERSWEAFLALGLPTQRHEHWRYTSVRPLQTLSAPVATRQTMALESSLPAYAAKLIIIDGVYDADHSDIVHKGISVSTAGAMNPIDAVKHPFAHLSSALSDQNMTITVAAHQDIKEPIEVIIMATTAAHAASMHMHHAIVLEKMAKATVFVHYRSLATERYWCNISRHITLKSGADLQLHILQSQADDAVHTEVDHIQPGRDAQLKITALSLGAKLARFDMDLNFEHEGASCTLVGGYHVQSSQVVDFHMAATHAVGHCTTEQYVQGIADGKSRAIFNGRVKINQQASKSKSLQTNYNLLLSDWAEIDTKPELEIDHDDVQCKHGATVGQLDPQALFYLQSRGLSLAQAKAVLQFAFMKQVIDKTDNTAIRELMTQALIQRWPEADIAQELS